MSFISFAISARASTGRFLPQFGKRRIRAPFLGALIFGFSIAAARLSLLPILCYHQPSADRSGKEPAPNECKNLHEMRLSGWL